MMSCQICGQVHEVMGCCPPRMTAGGRERIEGDVF